MTKIINRILFNWEVNYSLWKEGKKSSQYKKHQKVAS